MMLSALCICTEVIQQHLVRRYCNQPIKKIMIQSWKCCEYLVKIRVNCNSCCIITSLASDEAK